MEAEAVGELDLLQGVFEQTVLRVRFPGTGQLVLVKVPNFKDQRTSFLGCQV
jgi:hypothetical protein